MSIKQQLADMLTKQLELDIDINSISDEQSIQDLGMDSLVLVKLIYLLEDNHGVRLTTAEVLNVNTFGDLTALLGAKLGVAAAAK